MKLKKKIKKDFFVIDGLRPTILVLVLLEDHP
jgi:hypothetical protein